MHSRKQNRKGTNFQYEETAYRVKGSLHKIFTRDYNPEYKRIQKVKDQETNTFKMIITVRVANKSMKKKSSMSLDIRERQSTLVSQDVYHQEDKHSFVPPPRIGCDKMKLNISFPGCQKLIKMMMNASFILSMRSTWPQK